MLVGAGRNYLALLAGPWLGLGGPVRSTTWSACSRAWTRPARAAPSAASPRRSMRASTTRSRSRRRPTRSGRSPTCGASGATCRARAASPSTTGAGTGACWSSASRASARRRTGCAPIGEINDFEEQLARERRDRREVLAADLQGRAAPALQGAREDALQAVQDHARGLAQPREVGRLPGRRLPT